MKRCIITLLVVFSVAAVASAQVSYDNTRAKAERFFQHGEWASAAAMYNFMLLENPKDADTYGRAIVATELLGDTLRSMQLLNDAMKYAVPLDSVLAKVRTYSYQQCNAEMYETFMLDAIRHNPWMQRPIDAYLLDYYCNRKDAPQMIAYADKMLSGTPDNLRFLTIKAQGYMLNGEPDNAIATWRKILQLHPADYNALLCLANYYDINGDKAEALPYFQKASAIKPTPYVDQAIAKIKKHLSKKK